MVDLTSVALVGTSRAELPEDLGEFAVGDTPERRLLLTAGAEAVQRDAGRLPVEGAPVEPAPEESQLHLSLAASALFADALRRRDEGLVAEAVGQMRSHGVVLSPGLLVMALGQRSAKLREGLRPVLGVRGLWLAAFSREWSWALGSSSPSTATTDFEEGGPRRRLAALVELRQVDADKARETLKGIWPGLAAEQRLSLLQGLNSELGALDEPFLVELARDRSKRVQQAAAGLLARIPQSALSQRMVHRARASLGETLELPAAFGEDWAADGLVERPPRGIGERAWWLRQILAHCDLGALAGADINAWLATLPVDAPQVWLGVAEAAVRGRDPVWAERILDRLPATLDPQLRLALLGLTQPRAREQRVLRMMRANDALALRAVEVLDAPWSRRFSLQYLNHVATQAGHTPQGSHHQAWAATLRTAARAIPASCFAQAVSLHIPEGGGHHLWLRRRDDFLGILHFRKAFAGELSASIPGSSDD